MGLNRGKIHVRHKLPTERRWSEPFSGIAHSTPARLSCLSREGGVSSRPPPLPAPARDQDVDLPQLLETDRQWELCQGPPGTAVCRAPARALGSHGGVRSPEFLPSGRRDMRPSLVTAQKTPSHSVFQDYCWNVCRGPR